MNFSKNAFYSIILLTFLAACGNSNSNTGVGFGSATVTSKPAATTASGSSSLAEGTYKTAGGVPWLVYDSVNVMQGRSPLSQSGAMRAAVKYGSHRWRAPDAIKLADGQNSGMFRVVTVDGHTFGVLKKLNTPGFWPNLERQEAASQSLLQKGLKIARCKGNGTLSMRSNSQNVVNASVIPATC